MGLGLRDRVHGERHAYRKYSWNKKESENHRDIATALQYLTSGRFYGLENAKAARLDIRGRARLDIGRANA
jgi:hypothetical protein